MPLSPYVEEPLNSKVIKSFVPEQRSGYMFFEFRDSYFLSLWTFDVRFTHSHIMAMVHWLGIALSRQRVYPLAFTSTMLLPMAFEKKCCFPWLSKKISYIVLPFKTQIVYSSDFTMKKSWRQHPTKQQLYGHLPPITKTIEIRRTRHTGLCWRSRDELISDVLR